MELKIDKTDRLRCQICGKVCAKHCSLVSHLKRTHQIEDVKKYYDEHFKQEGEGFCKQCGKPVPFYTLKDGYRQFCDRKCFWQYTTHSDEVKEKRKQTCLEKYGTTQYLASKDCKEKSSDTLQKNYNVTNVFCLPDVKEKIRATKLAKGILHNEKQVEEKSKQVFEKYKELLKDSVEVLSYSNDEFTCRCKKCNEIFKIHYQNVYNRYNGNRENRINYQKHILVAQGFDENKSEREIMKERGIYRIYDCGALKYRYTRG